MRDLNADLAVCEAATRGNWLVADGVYVLDGESWETGGSFVAECEREADAEFTAKAREGWPEAIRRAIAAETKWHQLREVVATNATGGGGENINDYDIMLNVMVDIEAQTAREVDRNE